MSSAVCHGLNGRNVSGAAHIYSLQMEADSQRSMISLSESCEIIFVGLRLQMSWHQQNYDPIGVLSGKLEQDAIS